MALQGINNYEYSRLLGKVNSLPCDEAKELLKELTAIYGQYHEQLHELQDTIEAYEAVAVKIRARRNLKRDETNHLAVV